MTEQTISIHPPHAGRDQQRQGTRHIVVTFQSTRPMRGGTCNGWPRYLRWWISIHPPHAGRDPIPSVAAKPKHISIHPPHAGRDV